MSLRPYCFLAYTALSASLLAGEAPKPIATPALPPPPPYELKNHSKFDDTNAGQRPPFWPIGWVKRLPGQRMETQVAAPKIQLDSRQFRVTSILLGAGATPSLAVINGRAYSEGEFVRMPRVAGVSPIRIRVQRINDGNVLLQNGDQIIMAGLQRTDLPTHRPDEMLLDPDR